MRRTSVVAWVVAVLLSAGRPTLASEAYPACAVEPTAKDEEAARGAFSAGKAAYEEGDYPRAIDYWRDAYRRACTKHDLLKNIALAYELSGHEEEAAIALRTYLERVPDAPDRDQRLKKIEALESRAAAKKSEAEDASNQEPTPAPPPPPPADVAPERAEPARPAPRTNVPPLVIAGAGVLAGGVGLAGVVVTTKDVKDYREKCPNNLCNPDVFDDARGAYRARNAFGAVAIGGAALAIAGGVWFLLEPTKPLPRAAMLEPQVAPGFAGLTYRGSF